MILYVTTRRRVKTIVVAIKVSYPILFSIIDKIGRYCILNHFKKERLNTPTVEGILEMLIGMSITLKITKMISFPTFRVNSLPYVLLPSRKTNNPVNIVCGILRGSHRLTPLAHDPAVITCAGHT